jgi:hypothetical protein
MSELADVLSFEVARYSTVLQSTKKLSLTFAFKCKRIRCGSPFSCSEASIYVVNRDDTGIASISYLLPTAQCMRTSPLKSSSMSRSNVFERVFQDNKTHVAVSQSADPAVPPFADLLQSFVRRFTRGFIGQDEQDTTGRLNFVKNAKPPL